MNYIYDILLNFNDVFYEFYDWNSNDNIKHIRKIPIIRVSSDNFIKIKNYEIKFSDVFRKKFKNKTELFKSRKDEVLEYAFLISDGVDVLGICIDKNMKYSDLLIDEKDEVLDVVLKLDEEIIDFNIVREKSNFDYITRYEQKIVKYLCQEIDKMEKLKDSDKINYLYYECFDEKSDNYKIAIERIRSAISDMDNKFYLKLYNIFKLAALKK